MSKARIVKYIKVKVVYNSTIFSVKSLDAKKETFKVSSINRVHSSKKEWLELDLYGQDGEVTINMDHIVTYSCEPVFEEEDEPQVKAHYGRYPQ